MAEMKITMCMKPRNLSKQAHLPVPADDISYTTSEIKVKM